LSESKVFSLEDIQFVSLVKGAKSRLMMGKQIMLSFIEMEPGIHFPTHSHNCEQMMIVLEGGVHQRVGSKFYDLKSGDICLIPSNVDHEAKVSAEGCKAIDVFTPPREDYIPYAVK